METVKRILGREKQEGRMTATPSAQPATGGASVSESKAGATLQSQAPAPVSTGAPTLGRISTEYGEYEGIPYEPGRKRGPLSPRAQAIKEHLSKLMEETPSVQ